MLVALSIDPETPVKREGVDLHPLRCDPSKSIENELKAFIFLASYKLKKGKLQAHVGRAASSGGSMGNQFTETVVFVLGGMIRGTFSTP